MPDVVIFFKSDGVVCIQAASAIDAKAAARAVFKQSMTRLSRFESAELKTRLHDWSAMLDELSSLGTVVPDEDDDDGLIGEARVSETHRRYAEGCAAGDLFAEV